jgi:hypothetical protein
MTMVGWILIEVLVMKRQQLLLVTIEESGI